MLLLTRETLHLNPAQCSGVTQLPSAGVWKKKQVTLSGPGGEALTVQGECVSSLDRPEPVSPAIQTELMQLSPNFLASPRAAFSKSISDREGTCLITKANLWTQALCFQLVVYVSFTLEQNVPRCDIYEPYQLGAAHTDPVACGVGKR